MYENMYYQGVEVPRGVQIFGNIYEDFNEDAELPYSQPGDFVMFRDGNDLLNPHRWMLVVGEGYAFYFDPDKSMIYAKADIDDIIARGAVRAVIGPYTNTNVEQIIDQIKRLPDIQNKEAFDELFDYVWMSKRLLTSDDIKHLEEVTSR